MDNLAIYNQARNVPKEAQKPIKAGRLSGMTDINPMWRIKALTEIFGPCGIGWWYEVTSKEIVYDDITGQKAAFVDILLYYEQGGKTSHGIPGTGGASFVAKERNGPYLSDEAYKMALTDAISVAAKALGVGADIYWSSDRDKYTAATRTPEKKQEDAQAQTPASEPAKQEQAPAREPEKKQGKEFPLKCQHCGGYITAQKDKNDKEWSAIEIAEKTKELYRQQYCWNCWIEKVNLDRKYAKEN